MNNGRGINVISAGLKVKDNIIRCGEDNKKERGVTDVAGFGVT